MLILTKIQWRDINLFLKKPFMHTPIVVKFTARDYRSQAPFLFFEIVVIIRIDYKIGTVYKT